MNEDKNKTSPDKPAPETPDKGFELLDTADKGQNLTVRDDQYDYYWIADAAKRCRQKGFRFRLIDTGRFEKIELIWLIGSGLDLYTDDQTRTDFKELEELSTECTKAHSLCSYLSTEKWNQSQDSEGSEFSGLLTFARSGAYIYVSSKNENRDLSQIKELAEGCHESGTHLVYYHRGPVEPIFTEIGDQGAWIHLPAKSMDPEQRLLLIDTCQNSRQNGGGLILHLERAVEYDLVEDLMNAGAFVLFLYGHFDYKSPFKELQKRARRKKYDSRSYYLQHDFFL
ncbi:MAG: hypothetical protein GF421_00900 [Candidatus Aminicenantes bacterium]|nr:hypothetical protein [Candidatus Aminicenantes bacterium]